MVKANVDRILEILQEKKSVSINELAGKLSLPKTDVQKSAEYLEEDGVVKIDHKFPNTYVTLVKKLEKDKKEEKIEAPETVKEEPQQPEMSQPEFSQPTPSPPPMPMPEQPGPPVEAAPGIPLPPPPEQKPAEAPTQPQEIVVGEKPPTPNIEQETPKPAPEKPKSDKEPSKTPFLIDEPTDKKPNIAETTTSVMQESPLQESAVSQLDRDQNPLEPEQPKFEMAPPSPQPSTSNIVQDTIPSQIPPQTIEQPPQKEKKPSTFASQEEFAPKKEFTFPDYADTDVEKLEYLMDQAHDKLTNKDFQDINILYRAIYDMFTKSQDLSPNERHLLSEKIQDLFQKIKRLYLIEGVTV